MNPHQLCKTELPKYYLIQAQKKCVLPIFLHGIKLFTPLPIVFMSFVELRCIKARASNSRHMLLPYLNLRMMSLGLGEAGLSAQLLQWWDRIHQPFSWGMRFLMRPPTSCLWFGFERQVHSGQGDPSLWSILSEMEKVKISSLTALKLFFKNRFQLGAGRFCGYSVG